MTTVLAATILAAALIGAVWLMRATPPDRLLRERLCDKVVITLKTGAAFGGVLFATDGRVVVLRDTQALDPGPNAGPVVVDGELVLFQSDIAYMQRP